MWILNNGKVCLLIAVAAFTWISYQLILSYPINNLPTQNRSGHVQSDLKKDLHLREELIASKLASLQPILKEIDLPPEADDLLVERTFVELSESGEITCPKSYRIGNTGDGGWDVCEFGNFIPKKPCIVYSFGINYDWSFDDGILKKYDCVVRSFDPSMNIPDHWRKPSNVFLKEGLGGEDIILDNLWRMNTLKTIQHIFRDDDKIIDYVKFDIEGSEWPVLNTSIRDGSLLKVKQLAFEIHTDESHRETTSISKLRYYLDLLKGLRDLGFYRWYAHRNTLAPKFPSDRTGVDIWCCHEVVYLNINYL